jgi:hypothetical protein
MSNIFKHPIRNGGHKRRKIVRKRIKATAPDVVQLISREIFHQLRWELAPCSKGSRQSDGDRNGLFADQRL